MISPLITLEIYDNGNESSSFPGLFQVFFKYFSSIFKVFFKSFSSLFQVFFKSFSSTKVPSGVTFLADERRHGGRGLFRGTVLFALVTATGFVQPRHAFRLEELAENV